MTDIAVWQAPGRKCERCRRVLIEVGDWPDHPDLCLRCVDAVLVQETGEGMQEHAIRAFDAAYRAAVSGGSSRADAVVTAGGWVEQRRLDRDAMGKK